MMNCRLNWPIPKTEVIGIPSRQMSYIVNQLEAADRQSTGTYQTFKACIESYICFELSLIPF